MVAVASRLTAEEAFIIFDITTLPPPTQLKRQYRQLAKLHHPDRGGSKEFFQRLGEAYDILQDCIKNPHKVPQRFRRQAATEDQAIAIRKPTSREEVRKKLTDDQWVVCQEVLEWLANPCGQLELLMEGAAGVGKTYLVKYILEIANAEGLLGDGWVFGCAPQNPQKNNLRKSLGDYAHEYFTIHSLLNLRPKLVKFTARDQQQLEALLAIKPEHRTEQDQLKIIDLQQQARQAAKQEKEFMPAMAPDLSGVRLLIVDEAGMLGDRLLALLREAAGTSGDATLQILHMGDRAQLKPINGREKLKPGQMLSPKTQALYDAGFSLVFAVPSTTPLTTTVRYSGAIKEYVEEVRLYALGEKIGDEFTRLHRNIPVDANESLMVLQPFEVFDTEQLQSVFGEHSVRFVAMRNNRVDELNYIIGHLLREGQDAPRMIQGKGIANKIKASASRNDLFFMPNDIVLTMNPVTRALSSVYGLEANENGVPQVNTSTLIQLKRMASIGEKIDVDKGMSAYCPAGTVVVQPEFLQYKSVLGTNYHRTLFHYDIYGDDYTPENHVIALLEPEQRAQWKEELETLRLQAMSTVSRGKSVETSRGQNGDKAEAAWERYGLKNWFQWKDKGEVSVFEYDTIKKSLWRDYYTLKNFVDEANFSWASTCHRAQGMTVDIVILDMSDLLKTRSWGNQDLQELAQLLYTAATRARTQVIFLV